MAHPHLARTRLADLDILVAQDLGAAGLVESNRMGHGSVATSFRERVAAPFKEGACLGL